MLRERDAGEMRVESAPGTLLGGGTRRGALRPLKIPRRISSISTPNHDANGAYMFN